MRSSGNVVPIRQAQFSAKSPPRKPKNTEVRPREYLTSHEVESLIKAAKEDRHGLRDATMILIMYQHGVRVSEAVMLKWADIDFKSGVVSVRRVKKGQDGVHPIEWSGDTGATTPAAHGKDHLCLHQRAGYTNDHAQCPADRRSCRAGATLPGASSYAASWVRVQADQWWVRCQDRSAIFGTRQH
jgi:integrase